MDNIFCKNYPSEWINVLLNDFTEKVLAKQGIVQQSSVHESVEDKCFKVLLIHNIYCI